MITRKNKNDRPFNWQYIESLKDTNSFATIAQYLNHYTSSNSKEQQAILDMRNHYSRLARIRQGMLANAKSTKEEMAIDFKLGLDNGHFVKKFNTSSGTIDNIYYKNYVNGLNSIKDSNGDKRYIDFDFTDSKSFAKFKDIVGNNAVSYTASKGNYSIKVKKDSKDLINIISQYSNQYPLNDYATVSPSTNTISYGRLHKIIDLYTKTIQQANDAFNRNKSEDTDKITNTTIINTGTQGYGMYKLNKLLSNGIISNQQWETGKKMWDDYYASGLQSDLTQYTVYSDANREGDEAPVLREMDTKSRSELSRIIKSAAHDGYITSDNVNYAIVGNMVGAYITIPAKYEDKGVFAKVGEALGLTPEGKDITIFVKDLFKDDAEQSFRRDTNTRSILALNESDIYGSTLDALDKGFIESTGNNSYKLINKKDLSETPISREVAQQLMNRTYMIQDGVQAIKAQYPNISQDENAYGLVQSNIDNFSKQVFLQGQGDLGEYYSKLLQDSKSTSIENAADLVDLKKQVDERNRQNAGAEIEDIKTIMNQLYNLDE